MRKPLILAIDDMPDNLDLLVGLLGDRYKVDVTTSGERALVMLAKGEVPDLILLDLMMPGLDGFEVCELIKGIDEVSDVPIIVISESDRVEDKVKAFSKGCVDFITKPFHVAEIESRISVHIEQRRKRLELQSQADNLENLVHEQMNSTLVMKNSLLEAQHATVFAMAKLVEKKCEGQWDHIGLARSSCKIIVEEMYNRRMYSSEIDEDFVEDLYHACPLYDIGKVAIPDAILLKPGKLTTEEFYVLRTHVLHGSEFLKDVVVSHPGNTFVLMGEQIALYHHEKWDGSGYPFGIIGDDIPISAQIMALADVYAGLRSERPYKKAFSHQKSLEIILSERGKHFSPAMCDLFESIGPKLEQVVR